MLHYIYLDYLSWKVVLDVRSIRPNQDRLDSAA